MRNKITDGEQNKMIMNKDQAIRLLFVILASNVILFYVFTVNTDNFVKTAQPVAPRIAQLHLLGSPDSHVIAQDSHVVTQDSRVIEQGSTVIVLSNVCVTASNNRNLSGTIFDVTFKDGSTKANLSVRSVSSRFHPFWIVTRHPETSEDNGDHTFYDALAIFAETWHDDTHVYTFIDHTIPNNQHLLDEVDSLKEDSLRNVKEKYFILPRQTDSKIYAEFLQAAAFPPVLSLESLFAAQKTTCFKFGAFRIKTVRQQVFYSIKHPCLVI